MALNPIEQINLITIAALTFIFLATYFILRRMFFLPIIETMDRRSKKIEAAQIRLAEAGFLTATAEQEAEKMLSEAREEAERLAEQVKVEIAKTREAKIAEASAKADEILAKGREEVLGLKASEQAKLKEDLFACAKMTLSKLIGKVDEKTVRFMVNKVLASKGAGE